MPRVSVLMPTYNAEKFIERSLVSVINQDYENLEIVISDDYSSDKTVEIINKIIKQDIRHIIKFIINKKNIGITGNCNQILENCTGEYIACFAGDDLMYPGKIRQQVALMEENKDCSMSYHSVDVLDGDLNYKYLFTTEKNKQKFKSSFDIIEKIGILGACSIMARKECIPHYGFAGAYPYQSDWMFEIECAMRGKVMKVSGVLGAYLRHSSGASKKSFENLDEIKGILKKIQERYAHNRCIKGICGRGYRRYIYGELLRNLYQGDIKKAKIINARFSKEYIQLKIFNFLIIILIKLNINKLSFFRMAYDQMATRK